MPRLAELEDGSVIESVPAGEERLRYWELLLLADESESQVRSYINDGSLYGIQDPDGEPAAVVLITPSAAHEIEVKAVAVREDQQGRGLARRLLTLALDEQRRQGAKRAIVATGTTSFAPLALYQKLGFRLFRIDRDHFVAEHGYPDPIWENGIQLIDQVWLDRDL